MERKIVYGLIVFSITGLNTNEDCILMYPENLSVKELLKKLLLISFFNIINN